MDCNSPVLAEQTQITGKPVGTQLELWWDFDETLFATIMEKNVREEKQGLLETLLPTLSEKTYIYDYTIDRYHYKALYYDQVLDIFKNITDINKLFQCYVVKVNIITNANYDQSYVSAILNFFFDEPISECTGFGLQISQFVNRERDFAKKADYIANYNSQFEFPAEKSYLIDDSEKNCREAEESKIGAIRLCTSIVSLRVEDLHAFNLASFDRIAALVEEAKRKAFEELNSRKTENGDPNMNQDDLIFF